LSGTPTRFGLPKSARILCSSDFRKVYEQGIRVNSRYFAAFCLAVEREASEGPRLGFTVPRAFGRAVSRNRAKRRMREALRPRLSEMDARWDVVVNPRRTALAVPFPELQREVNRLVLQCKKS
jgi:ribonuclease P protein component